MGCEQQLVAMLTAIVAVLGQPPNEDAVTVYMVLTEGHTVTVEPGNEPGCHAKVGGHPVKVEVAEMDVQVAALVHSTTSGALTWTTAPG